jgi:arylsulfatase A-like enzyme
MLTVVVSALLITGPSLPAAGSEVGKKNVIFLLTDDQRDKTFGGMGHPWVKTPHVDRLMKQGIRFSNAYIAEPTCSPSRVSIFTGMHERVHGIGFTSSYQLNEQQWETTYPALLRNHGYYTGFIGKIGIEYYTFRSRPEEKFDFWRGHNGWARFFHRTASNCAMYRQFNEDIITPAMGECMDEFFNSIPVDKPLCLSVSFSIPHGSQTTTMYPDVPEGRSMMRPANQNPKLKNHAIYGNLYRDVEFEIPSDTATDPYRFIPKRVMDQAKGRATRAYKYDYDRVSCKEHHIRYYQQITGLDREIGKLVDTLKRKRLWQNTVIIFASDHGLLMGEYGMGGKALLYDLASKIPCFIYSPEMKDTVRGTTCDKLVSSLDLTTTILDYAGIEAPTCMAGNSLRTLIDDPSAEWRTELFLENLYTGRDTPFSEGIRQGDWKYIRMFDGVTSYKEEDVNFAGREPDFEQLFNLKEDPQEKVNLIVDYEGTELLTRLRRKVAAYSESLNKQRTAYKRTVSVTPRGRKR